MAGGGGNGKRAYRQGISGDRYRGYPWHRRGPRAKDRTKRTVRATGRVSIFSRVGPLTRARRVFTRRHHWHSRKRWRLHVLRGRPRGYRWSVFENYYVNVRKKNNNKIVRRSNFCAEFSWVFRFSFFFFPPIVFVLLCKRKPTVFRLDLSLPRDDIVVLSKKVRFRFI